jgi:hypothetical protein
VGVVCGAGGRVGEEGVGSDEEAVTLEAGMKGEGGGRGGRVVAVWMVELDKGVEAGFGVRGAWGASEDLVRRREGVRVSGGRPMEVGRVVGVMGGGFRFRGGVRGSGVCSRLTLRRGGGAW